MLRLLVPSREIFDNETQTFKETKPYELQLEHSLVSLSKWESKWLKPFLSKTDMTTEETLDYIRCMTVNQNVVPIDYNLIPQNSIDEIRTYIDAPMTATTFGQPDKKVTSKEVITAEIVYYWMISFNIPFECQRWHLNRLLTLVNVCNIKNQPAKKMTTKEAAAQRRLENERRKAKYNTKG